jgi:hypothetical protein
MSLNGDDNCSSTAWSPHTDPVTLSIVSGSQYVSFHVIDSLTGADTKLGSTATTIGDNIGEYYLVADGITPDSSGDWATIQAVSNGMTGTDSVEILPLVDHFYVYTVPDTINDSATTTVYVQAKDAYNQNLNYNGSIQISASPSAFGNLVYNSPPPASSTEKGGTNGKQVTMSVSSSNGTSSSILRNVNTMGKKSIAAVNLGFVVNYSAANSGQVLYIANGTVPDSNTTINFTVTAVSDVTKTGMGTVVILGSQAELEVKYPTDAQMITGDDLPKMPDVSTKIKAQLHDKKNIPVDYKWEMKIKWSGKAGWKTPQNDESYSGGTTGQTNKWTYLNVNLDKYIRGGQTVTLKVVATTADYSVTKNYDSTFAIKGTNPDTATVLAELKNHTTAAVDQYAAVAWHESPGFHQFGGDKYPLQGGDIDSLNDFGIMGIHDPNSGVWDYPCDDLIWDWVANVQQGQNYFDNQIGRAKNYHNMEYFKENYETTPDPLQEGEQSLDPNQYQVFLQAYCYYNGGTNARYWDWIPPVVNEQGYTRSPGYWVKNTTTWRTVVPHVDQLWQTFVSKPWSK